MRLVVKWIIVDETLSAHSDFEQSEPNLPWIPRTSFYSEADKTLSWGKVDADFLDLTMRFTITVWAHNLLISAVKIVKFEADEMLTVVGDSDLSDWIIQRDIELQLVIDLILVAKFNRVTAILHCKVKAPKPTVLQKAHRFELHLIKRVLLF